MQLLDDHIFQLWRRGVIEKADGMMKCNKPDDLAARIAQAEKGLFDDEDDGGNGERKAG
jgi:twitching motility protein PilT